MKTKMFTLMMICIAGNFITAQTLIKTADFDMMKAATILKNKGYAIVDQDETYIKIRNKENSVLFMDFLDAQKKFLYFNTNILLKKDASAEKIELLLAEINDLNMIKAKFDQKNRSIIFQYYYWTENSFTKESFEDAVNEFFLYQGDAYGLDKEKLFEYE